MIGPGPLVPGTMHCQPELGVVQAVGKRPARGVQGLLDGVLQGGDSVGGEVEGDEQGESGIGVEFVGRHRPDRDAGRVREGDGHTGAPLSVRESGAGLALEGGDLGGVRTVTGPRVGDATGTSPWRGGMRLGARRAGGGWAHGPARQTQWELGCGIV